MLWKVIREEPGAQIQQLHMGIVLGMQNWPRRKCENRSDLYWSVGYEDSNDHWKTHSNNSEQPLSGTLCCAIFLTLEEETGKRDIEQLCGTDMYERIRLLSRCFCGSHQPLSRCKGNHLGPLWSAPWDTDSRTKQSFSFSPMVSGLCPFDIKYMGSFQKGSAKCQRDNVFKHSSGLQPFYTHHTKT